MTDMKNRNFERLRNRNRLTKTPITDPSPDAVGRMILSDLKTAFEASFFSGEQAPSRIHIFTDEWESPIESETLLRSKTGLAQ